MPWRTVSVFTCSFCLESVNPTALMLRKVPATNKHAESAREHLWI